MDPCKLLALLRGLKMYPLSNVSGLMEVTGGVTQRLRVAGAGLGITAACAQVLAPPLLSWEPCLHLGCWT